MSILPDLPGIASYYTPLTVEAAAKLPLDALICRSLLTLHRESAASGARTRSIEHIPSTDVKHALAHATEIFKRSIGGAAPKIISSLDSLAAFLLHLEEGKAKEKLLEDFSKLTTEDKTFLCYHLWQGMGRPEGDPDYGLHEIEKDPSILRRIKTADGKNLVEKLIDIRTEQKILPELQELIGKSPEEIQASSRYNLLCWFVWWQDGGKDDPHFGEEDYGRKQLADHPEGLARCIESLIKEIHSKAALIEIPGLHYEEHALAQYRELDQQVFREMVEGLLKDRSVNLCFNIQKFGITDQTSLAEIAMIAAKTSPRDLCFNIQKFGITNEASLVEIAKIALAASPRDLCFNIQKFGMDPASLVEIAKIAAKTSPSDLVVNIQKFEIANQEDLESIAMLFVENAEEGTLGLIGNFGITAESARTRIAIHAAAFPNSRLCFFIAQFGIKDQAALLQIARVAAATEGSGLCAYMRNFNIRDSDSLVQIARIAAATPGSNLGLCLGDFGISNPAILCELARIAAATPRSYLGRDIENYEIKDLSILFEIAKIAASTPGSEFCRYIENLGFFDKTQRDELLEIASEQYLRNIAGSIVESKQSDVKKAIKGILNIRDSKLRIDIFDHFMKSVVKDGVQERYFRLADTTHKALPMIFIADWLFGSSLPLDSVTAIQDMFKKFREDFRSASSKLAPLTLNLLSSLQQEDSLAFKDKLALFNQVCAISPDLNTLKRNLGLLLILIKFGFFHERGISALPENFTQKDLIEALNSKVAMPLFGKAVLSSEEVDRYLRFTETQRRPFALELYASRTTDEDTKKEMVRFVGSLMDGSFKSRRYAATGNPHLSVLASMNVGGSYAAPQSLLDLWQDLSTQNTEARAAGGAGAATPAAASAVEAGAGLPSFGAWLVQKLISDAHLTDADAKLPTLMGLLRSGKDVRAGAEEILASTTKTSDVERACLEVLGKDSKEEFLISLKKLKESAEKNTDLKGSQWKRDIQDLIEMMGAKAQVDFVAQITDDWQDLFLCGTEVLGSCQAIEGDPEINKALLGYCMDGKIQMAALKDPDSGKIIARALLKLLIKEEMGSDGAVRRVPVIFLERIYPENPTYITALNELAKARARHLGVELYTHNESIETGSEKVQLRSLGTSGPYEYEDGGVGVSDGVYTIAEARRVML